jgi:hypothetical protein
MDIVRIDLQSDELRVVFLDDKRYKLAKKIEVVPLAEVPMAEIVNTA